MKVLKRKRGKNNSVRNCSLACGKKFLPGGKNSFLSLFQGPLQEQGGSA
jgi:hypothetical protein